ncbi:MAG TPA: bifunctional [glutamate--ammonia ligase]-adenylyl-L-tyrosine phosphorylase/[glutamate--ammonia-ligase] adenylyltransferase [Candidatus Limnocylindria bacterium]|nr:bifunctional [glutamate--ammonia ligase]-adenylyl-L-tyrosine phosphorylase/[glutamate--ammonia-ligase] adenylyltransferase [Candidatus Limnocylindria bacterium]
MSVTSLLSAAADDRAALRRLKALGFADPAGALSNLHALTPTPREAELLAPALSRLLAELGAAPDPDMALNNLERQASQGERATFLRLLSAHPGAIPLLARLGGTSQFLADTLRRYPTLLPWLLEPRTMRQWLADELAEDLAASLKAFERPEARLNALRRFKYRQLLRIGCRDILGDADLTVTTEELSHMADVCLAAAWDWARERLERLYGTPMGADGLPTGLAVIGMGKLGGEELNYSSDIDPVFVYGEDGETAGGEAGRLANGEFFTQAVRSIVATLETVTEEGHVFRVDLRLRPEGRSGALIRSVDGYRRYFDDRAELWERQALIKARACAGDPAVAARFFEAVRPFVYRTGLDPAIVRAVREMKGQIDRALRGKDASHRNVKLGRGGIREVEFLVQAMQLLYGGDDPWLRERNSLRAIFRLTERGYLPHALGRELGDALVYLRTVEHRLQILHEFQTHTLPEEPRTLGLLARRMGVVRPPIAAARRFMAEHRRVTGLVHRAFREFFAAAPAAAARPLRIPSYTALKATGFTDPDRARQNLRLVLEGRPLIPYPAAAGRAMARLFPVLLDALWQSPDPDEALSQFERFVGAAGPRTAYLDLLADRPELLTNLVRLCARGELLTELLIAQPELLSGLASPETFASKRARDFRRELGPVLAPRLPAAARPDVLRRLKQAQELGIIWRMLLGVTDTERFSLEMTALAEVALAVAWILALEGTVAQYGVPRDARGRLVPAAIIGLGKFGGRELTTGSDLDLFVVYGGAGFTDGEPRVEAHVFYDRAVETLSGLLSDITAAGVAFAVDLRLRPGSKGSGFATSDDALERYYREWADPWERQTLTRARLVGGDPRLGRAVRRRIRGLLYGPEAPPPDLKEMRTLRERMERELGKETPGRFHVKFGRGGLVDVEFITQALQMRHGTRHPGLRRANTLHAIRAIAAAGLLPAADCATLAEQYRFLRRVSLGLRLFGTRPSDTLELAGPNPARLAKTLDYPSRKELIEDYRRRTAWVRALYDRVVPK